MLPGSAVGLPSAAPRPAAMPATPDVVTRPEPPPGGATMMVPGVGELPIVDISKPAPKPEPGAAPPKPRKKLDPALLQQFLSRPGR
jgi:hypothetical protein